MPMKHLPNILSSLRIVGTVVLLLSDVSSILFGVLYIVCGFSDIADGHSRRMAGSEAEVRHYEGSIAG